MSKHVEVTRSESGQWWRMSYKGKVEFCEEEPSEREKAKFKVACDCAPRDPVFSGHGNLTVKEMGQ